MKTVCVKSLLLMITCIFTAHASEKPLLEFTQDDYFKMETSELTAKHRTLQKLIEMRKDEVGRNCCGKELFPCDACLGGSLALVAGNLVLKDREFRDENQARAAFCMGALCTLGTYVAIRTQLAVWYSRYVTRPFRQELEIIDLALIKNAGKDKDKTA